MSWSSNAEVERFYEDLQDLLELTPKKDVLLLIEDWNAKVGSQETPGVTGKFDLGVQNEARQRLEHMPGEHTGHSQNSLPTKKRRLYTWTSFQFSSVAQSCPTLCDPMNCSTPDLLIHHKLLEFTQTHAHRVGDATSHLILCCPLLLLPPIPPSIRVFSNVSTLRMRWPKYWIFSFSIIPSK